MFSFVCFTAFFVFYLGMELSTCLMIKHDSWDKLGRIAVEPDTQEILLTMSGCISRSACNSSAFVNVLVRQSTVELEVRGYPGLFFLGRYFLPTRFVNRSDIAIREESGGVQWCEINCGDPRRIVKLTIPLKTCPGGIGLRVKQ